MAAALPGNAVPVPLRQARRIGHLIEVPIRIVVFIERQRQLEQACRERLRACGANRAVACQILFAALDRPLSTFHGVAQDMRRDHEALTQRRLHNLDIALPDEV